MPLVPGTRLGPYEVVAPLGAGGMGEVYRARDGRLERDVAIKVLPESFAGDDDRRARFDREAKAVAALSHPNILAIYDTGIEGDKLFVVTELLEGETLRERLTAPLPVGKATDIASQLSRGLSAAHARGIVHRDLKPENVFLTRDGLVKILDFGLARQVPSGTGATETAAALTDPGVVMGTMGYMAPEQVRGQAVDARADLFSLGAVLYEMLTGRRAFQRDTAADTMFAIVKEEPPDMAASGAAVAPALDRIVRHCLEKNPAERFQTARDVAFALEVLTGSGPSVPGAVASRASGEARIGGGQPGSSRPLASPLVAATAVALVLAAFAVGSWWSTPRRHWPTRWIGEDLGGSPIAFAPRVAPNGQDIAFEAMVDNRQTQVAWMKPGTGTYQTLTSRLTDGQATALTWSRDGSRILFSRIFDQPRGIYEVDVAGSAGERQLWPDASMPHELQDGELLMTQINADRQPQLHRLRKGSQTPEPLDAVTASAWSTSRVFPDFREVAFFGFPKSGESRENQLHVLDLTTGRTRRIAPGVSFTDWEPVYGGFPMAVTADWLVFARRSGDIYEVVAAPRDGSTRLETLFTTTAEPVNIDIGPDQTVYVDQAQQGGAGIARFPSLSGSPSTEFLPNLQGFVLPLSDHRVLATERVAGKRRVVVLESGKPPQPLLPSATDETTSPFTLLGADRVALLEGSAVPRRIAIVSMQTRRVERRLSRVKEDVTSLAGSPSGDTLYYVAAKRVFAVSSDDDRDPQPLCPGDSVAVDPSGRYLVVKRNERDAVRLLRVPLPFGSGPEQEIAIPQGRRLPAFDPVSPGAVSRDGRILMRIAPPDNWYWPAAILDARPPGIPRLEPIEMNSTTDQYMPAWTTDGLVVSRVSRAESRLMRFRPLR